MPAPVEVLIIGGGVIGLSIARSCVDHGLTGTVLDAGQPGAGSTGAAAGILSPTDPAEWDGALGEYNLRAIAGWAAWQEALAEEVGLPTGYEARGELRVGTPGGVFLAKSREGATRAGWEIQEVDAAHVAKAEPGLVLGELGALLMPRTAAVNTDQLVPALLAACRRRGIRLRPDSRVVDADLRGRSVTLADGERIEYGTAVLAAGSWSAMEFLPEDVRPAIRPRLGEHLLLADLGTPFCSRPVRTENGSVVPRADGSYWVGTTVLDRGFQGHPSLGSVRSIADNAVSLLPALDDALVLRAASGLRPVSADGLPVVGAAVDGFVVATGHGREGIIHAPSCADDVAAGVATGDWSSVPEDFRPAAGRFAAEDRAA